MSKQAKTRAPLAFHEVTFSTRFVQGYRFLDRCGEALVSLEDTLDKEWLTGEATPKGGGMKNEVTGMVTGFNSESMSVTQSEYFDAALFIDQACKIYAVLRDKFEIGRINAPSMRLQLQRGFEDTDPDEASRVLNGMGLCSVPGNVLTLVGGEKSSLDFTLVTTSEAEWQEQRVRRRRRMVTSVLRQERLPTFDERLIRRARLLPQKQAEAISAILNARKRMPEVFPVAIQFDLETSFEEEFAARSFDLAEFLRAGWTWAEHVREELDKIKEA